MKSAGGVVEVTGGGAQVELGEGIRAGVQTFAGEERRCGGYRLAAGPM